MTAKKKPAVKKRKKAGSSQSQARRLSRAKIKKEKQRKEAREAKVEREATHRTRRKPRGVAKETERRFTRQTKNFTDKERDEAKQTIVRTLVLRGSLREACIAAGIARQTAKDWKKRDAAFAAAWDASVAEAYDRLEDEAYRRGAEGFDRPIIFQGKVTGQYTDYSDSLLQTMLRGNKPSKYKDRTEHSTPKDQPMQIDVETKGDVMSTILGMIQSKPDA